MVRSPELYNETSLLKLLCFRFPYAARFLTSLGIRRDMQGVMLKNLF